MAESVNQTQQRKRKGLGPLPVLLVLAVAAGAVLHVAGPHKGWITRLTEKPPVGGRAPDGDAGKGAAHGVKLPPPPGMADELLPEPAGAAGNAAPGEAARTPAAEPAGRPNERPPAGPPAKTALELEYEKLYETALKQMRRPQPGKAYKIRLRNGSSVEGKLRDVSPGKISLVLKYGVMTYAINQVHPQYIPRLFPERTAQRLALRELRRRQDEERKQAQAAAAPDPAVTVAATAPPEVGGTATPPPAPPPVRPRTKLRYDPRPAKTPESLKSTITAFGQWLEVQHRRVGGKIADKIHAKQQGPYAVLYVTMNPTFLEQDFDVRFQLAEGLQKFWAFRCEGTQAVHDLSDAHVVLLNGEGKFVGGSSPTAAAEVWVAKD